MEAGGGGCCRGGSACHPAGGGSGGWDPSVLDAGNIDWRSASRDATRPLPAAAPAVAAVPAASVWHPAAARARLARARSVPRTGHTSNASCSFIYRSLLHAESRREPRQRKWRKRCRHDTASAGWVHRHACSPGAAAPSRRCDAAVWTAPNRGTWCIAWCCAAVPVPDSPPQPGVTGIRAGSPAPRAAGWLPGTSRICTLPPAAPAPGPAPASSPSTAAGAAATSIGPVRGTRRGWRARGRQQQQRAKLGARANWARGR